MTIYKLNILPQSDKKYVDRSPEEGGTVGPFTSPEKADEAAKQLAIQWAVQHGLSAGNVITLPAQVIVASGDPDADYSGNMEQPKILLRIQRISIGASAEEIAQLSLEN